MVTNRLLNSDALHPQMHQSYLAFWVSEHIFLLLYSKVAGSILKIELEEKCSKNNSYIKRSQPSDEYKVKRRRAEIGSLKFSRNGGISALKIVHLFTILADEHQCQAGSVESSRQ